MRLIASSTIHAPRPRTRFTGGSPSGFSSGTNLFRDMLVRADPSRCDGDDPQERIATCSPEQLHPQPAGPSHRFLPRGYPRPSLTLRLPEDDSAVRRTPEVSLPRPQCADPADGHRREWSTVRLSIASQPLFGPGADRSCKIRHSRGRGFDIDPAMPRPENIYLQHSQVWHRGGCPNTSNRVRYLPSAILFNAICFPEVLSVSQLQNAGSGHQRRE